MPTRRPQRLWLLKLVVLALIIGAGREVRSDTPTVWTGTVSSNWTDPLNWSPNAVPSTNIGTAASVISSATNICVITANTTQSVYIIRIGGTDATTYGKLILQPGAVLNALNGSTLPSSENGPIYFGCGANYLGYFELQSNATFNTSVANNMALAGWGLPCQVTVAVNGGRFVDTGNMSLGGANEQLANLGHTGALYVSHGGFVSCVNMRLGYGESWWTTEWGGRGSLTISDAGSRFQCSGSFTSGNGSKGVTPDSGGRDCNGRGIVTLYGGTLSAGGNYYNALAVAGCTNNTNTAECIVRGGQLLVTGTFYNSNAETNNEFGTLTIASGATNLLVGGDYYQRTNGTLVAEITAPSHPPLKVNGIAYLAGTLRIAGNSVEQLGHWDIILGDADNNSGTPGVSGQFTTFDASATGHPANWSVAYSADKVTVSCIPEGTLIEFQ